MTCPRLRAFLWVVASLAGLPAANGANRDPYRLKPGATGKVCFDCHSGIEDEQKRPWVHTPVKNGACTSCHNPHASSHGKLLLGPGGDLCAGCHAVVVQAKAKSSHAPAVEGKCLSCHKAHAGDERHGLVKSELELCGSCHKAVIEGVKAAKVKHAPLQKQGCSACHLPHASSVGDHLLTKIEPALCLGCHKASAPAFTKKHVGYPVATGRCTDCHDPHGGRQKGMLYERVHSPVAKSMCGACHQPPAPGRPIALKKTGVELCRSCHNDVINGFMTQGRVHAPVLSADGCLACHSPHASKDPGLLRASGEVVCGACHGDTLARQRTAATHHEPVQKGECGKCHTPHGGTGALYLRNSDTIELCGSCHDWQKHSTHPIGPTKLDPRNKNLTMDCLSCHRAHGTEYKHMIPLPTATALCTQCHQDFKR